MAMYDTSGGSNWDEILKRGGVTGTTQAPPLSSGPDPNGEVANATHWPNVQTAAGTDGTPTQPSTPTQPTGRNSQDAVNAAYQQYLGRGMGADEYQYWANVPDFAQQIAGSQEARSRTPTTTSSAPTAPTGPTAPQGMDPNQWAYQAQALRDAYWKYLYRLPTQEEIQSFAAKGSNDFASHMQSIPTSWEALRTLQQNGGKTNSAALPSDGAATTTTTTQPQGGTPGSLAWVQQQLARYKSTDDPNYWVRVMAADPKVAAGDQSAIDYWLMRMSIGDGAEAVRTGQARPYDHGSGSAGGYTGTTAFSDPATQQWETMLRQVADRLMNPTPDATKELHQTQALDPLERQRQTMKQQTAQRLSQRGITPTSGTWDEAMREVDRQFNELRTRTQAGFANTFAQNDENRMLQATNLFKQIPQYQDTRLQLAQNTLIPTNVGSLLNLQQQGNQWDSQQQQAFWTNLANAVSQLLQNR